MLVLTRKIGEKLVIGGNITVSVIEINGSRVRLGIEAPRQVSIARGELVDAQVGAMCDPELREKPAEWFLECELDAALC